MGPDVPEISLGEAARAGQQALKDAGIEGAGRDARLLVAAAAGCTTADIIAHPERMLSAEAGLSARRGWSRLKM